MILKKILAPERIRQIEGSFGFIPHRFPYRWILSRAESVRTAVVSVSDYGRGPLWPVLL